MSAMLEMNDFALILRPLGALEKAEPGAKRVLSSMVADTLALTKPILRVLVGHRGSIGDAFEMVLKFELGRKFNLRFFRFGDKLGFGSRSETELLKLAQECPFDLIFAYSYLKAKEKELFARLKAQYAKPIIVTNLSLHDSSFFPSELVEAGVVDAFLPSPFTIYDFRSALKACRRFPASTDSTALFDEAIYKHAKPHFDNAWENAKAGGSSILDFLKELFERWGDGIKPYLKRWREDLVAETKRAANEKLAAASTSPTRD